MTDRELKMTPAGYSLYNFWSRCPRRAPVWHKFRAFYRWAISSGYNPGCWIQWLDKDEPIGPGNCKVRQPNTRSWWADNLPEKFDTAAARIWQLLGMADPADGCRERG